MEGEPVSAAPAAPSARARGAAVLPDFVALHPDIHAFRAFADGGWDGNWYVGFNTCWIVKLPSAPAGNYARAYLGERLGRAKTRPRRGGATWDKDPIPGKVYMAISTFPAFSPAQSFYLADTADIPQEPDYENPNLEVGHGEWFWTEVPLKLLNFDGPNYLATWSNTETLISAASSPILGAAMDPSGSKASPRAWLNSGIAGVPPRDQNAAIGVPVSFYLPSLAIKLVPANAAILEVRGFSVAASTPAAFEARFALAGQDPELASVEASPDGMGWERVTPLLRHPPYSFLIPDDRFGRPYALSGAVYLRGAGQDALGTLGFSEVLQLPFSAKSSQ